MTDEQFGHDEPCYVISVAARMVSLHPQTLRYYDRVGLIKPVRTSGRIRLYRPSDIRRLRKIARLTEDLGVNLAGVEVVLNMSNRIQELQRELEQMRSETQAEIAALRQALEDYRRKESGRQSAVINVSAREIEGKDKS